MNTYSILIILCVLIIFSYFFDLFARKTNVPAVLLLFAFGAGIKVASEKMQWPLLDFSTLLPILGTVGLILIVLEGSLELKYERGKGRLIRQAFGAALMILLITSFGIAGIFQYFTQASFYDCLMNAVPYSVISSAIAIPSVAGMSNQSKKEFIIYESSFSDILGIMLFNFVAMNQHVSGNSFLHLGWELVLIALICLLFCFGLLFIMGRMRHQVKFFLIIASVILIYAVAKSYHLSSLTIVLVFGLFLENNELILSWLAQFKPIQGIKRVFQYDSLHEDLFQLKQFSLESAFLLRTFFFLVFGYTLDIQTLTNPQVWWVGGSLIAVIYSIRFIYMRFVTKAHVWPEILISPRGLITVLLFLQIPAEHYIFQESNGILVFAVITTSLLMTLALVFSNKKPQVQEELE